MKLPFKYSYVYVRTQVPMCTYIRTYVQIIKTFTLAFE